jgi:hypothetical protein
MSHIKFAGDKFLEVREAREISILKANWLF